jgi:hypothetical protein
MMIDQRFVDARQKHGFRHTIKRKQSRLPVLHKDTFLKFVCNDANSVVFLPDGELVQRKGATTDEPNDEGALVWSDLPPEMHTDILSRLGFVDDEDCATIPRTLAERNLRAHVLHLIAATGAGDGFEDAETTVDVLEGEEEEIEAWHRYHEERPEGLERSEHLHHAQFSGEVQRKVFRGNAALRAAVEAADRDIESMRRKARRASDAGSDGWGTNVVGPSDASQCCRGGMDCIVA